MFKISPRKPDITHHHGWTTIVHPPPPWPPAPTTSTTSLHPITVFSTVSVTLASSLPVIYNNNNNQDDNVIVLGNSSSSQQACCQQQDWARRAAVTGYITMSLSLVISLTLTFRLVQKGFKRYYAKRVTHERFSKHDAEESANDSFEKPPSSSAPNGGYGDFKALAAKLYEQFAMAQLQKKIADMDGKMDELIAAKRKRDEELSEKVSHNVENSRESLNQVLSNDQSDQVTGTIHVGLTAEDVEAVVVKIVRPLLKSIENTVSSQHRRFTQDMEDYLKSINEVQEVILAEIQRLEAKQEEILQAHQHDKIQTDTSTKSDQVVNAKPQPLKIKRKEVNQSRSRIPGVKEDKVPVLPVLDEMGDIFVGLGNHETDQIRRMNAPGQSVNIPVGCENSIPISPTIMESELMPRKLAQRREDNLGSR